MLPKKVPFKHGDEPIVQGTEITYTLVNRWSTMPGGKKDAFILLSQRSKNVC